MALAVCGDHGSTEGPRTKPRGMGTQPPFTHAADTRADTDFPEPLLQQLRPEGPLGTWPPNSRQLRTELMLFCYCKRGEGGPEALQVCPGSEQEAGTRTQFCLAPQSSNVGLGCTQHWEQTLQLRTPLPGDLRLVQMSVALLVGTGMTWLPDCLP